MKKILIAFLIICFPLTSYGEISNVEKGELGTMVKNMLSSSTLPKDSEALQDEIVQKVLQEKGMDAVLLKVLSDIDLKKYSLRDYPVIGVRLYNLNEKIDSSYKWGRRGEILKGALVGTISGLIIGAVTLALIHTRIKIPQSESVGASEFSGISTTASVEDSTLEATRNLVAGAREAAASAQEATAAIKGSEEMSVTAGRDLVASVRETSAFAKEAASTGIGEETMLKNAREASEAAKNAANSLDEAITAGGYENIVAKSEEASEVVKNALASTEEISSYAESLSEGSISEEAIPNNFTLGQVFKNLRPSSFGEGLKVLKRPYPSYTKWGMGLPLVAGGIYGSYHEYQDIEGRELNLNDLNKHFIRTIKNVQEAEDAASKLK